MHEHEPDNVIVAALQDTAASLTGRSISLKETLDGCWYAFVGDRTYENGVFGDTREVALRNLLTTLQVSEPRTV